jgi:BRCA1-associated protein
METPGQHGLEHHRDTGHNYAIELESQRVWDYTGDCYVHRLIHNRLDGKMVSAMAASVNGPKNWRWAGRVN